MIKIKRVFILSLIISCFFVVKNTSAQKVGAKVNAIDKDGKRHGNWKKYYRNGNLRYTGNFNHGKEIGTFMYFDMTSRKHPTIIKIFSKDSDIAKVEYFTTRGDVRSRGKMKGKKRIGKWTYYFPSGKVFSEEFYTDGKLDGTLKNYYPNGKLTEKTEYKNGLKNGVSQKFGDDGALIEEMRYVDNKPNGLAKFFDVKGNLKETGEYKNGKRVGKWDFYIDGEAVSSKEKRKKKTHSIPK